MSEQKLEDKPTQFVRSDTLKKLKTWKRSLQQYDLGTPLMSKHRQQDYIGRPTSLKEKAETKRGAIS
ncbi:hypothetical protein CLAC_00180 [Corynebacterium lactis RW2-5]|uniref:Uncharacterized protein n=1 Tax=Corynebacterium lactis RW2-5 TaxID=1408189 RepID=A0A0K2H2S8_9CORY|nr:hypothetical protein CLAC_00180 [Corynebacterium lactis RW2-5]